MLVELRLSKVLLVAVALEGPAVAPALSLSGTSPRAPPNSPSPSPGSGSPVALGDGVLIVIFMASKPAPAKLPGGVSDGTIATVGVVMVWSVDMLPMLTIGW